MTHAAANTSGAGLDWRLSVSFGTKTHIVRALNQLWVLVMSCYSLSEREYGRCYSMARLRSSSIANLGSEFEAVVFWGSL